MASRVNFVRGASSRLPALIVSPVLVSVLIMLDRFIGNP
jgi:hypothetical protein